MVEPTYIDQIDPLKTLFGIVFLLVQGWFGFAIWVFSKAQKIAAYTMKQIDENQARTALKLEKISEEFNFLKGQHDALMCQHNSRGINNDFGG